MRHARRSRGFIIIEMLGGLLLIGAVATLFAVALNRQQQAGTRLADQRAAIRRAEAALLRLDGESPATMPADVTTRRLATTAPAGLQWIEVSAPAAGHPIRLTGLVPERQEPR